MNDKYLIRGKPVIFTENLARILGVADAIILQKLEFWLQVHEKDGSNFIDGRYWNYNSLTQWQKEISFYSKSTIEKALNNLRKQGIIIVGKFNKMKIDRTLWYTIDYDKLREIIDNFGNTTTLCR